MQREVHEKIRVTPKVKAADRDAGRATCPAGLKPFGTHVTLGEGKSPLRFCPGSLLPDHR